MERLASLDAGFLTLESRRVYTHIGSVTLLDGEVAAAALAGRIADRLHLLPPFRRRLVEVPLGLGQPYWAEDPDFDLGFHVRETALPAPGDDRQLADAIAQVFSVPLDRTRPLWEVWVIGGLANGWTAMLTKIHHAAVDGVSGTELLTALLDGADDDGGDRHWRGERIPSELELLARAMGNLALAPARAVLAAPAGLRALPRLPGLSLAPGAPTLLRALSGERVAARAPDTPFNGPITAHRRWAWGGLSLERVKAVKDAGGVTLNDVVVTLCAASVGAWLADHDALPGEPLLAAIPVSARGDDDGDFGNRVGLMAAPIATHLDDPLERLAWTAEALTEAKEHHGGEPADTLLDASHPVPPAVASLAARAALNSLSRMRSPLNLLISNVPGPRDALEMLGAEVQGIYPVPPLTDGLGLNITVVSYRDVLGVGLMVDREQVGDAWPLLDGLETALGELETALA